MIRLVGSVATNWFAFSNTSAFSWLSRSISTNNTTGIAFASALSTHRSLYEAVTECVKQIRQQLPATKHFTFCQILITPSYHSCGIDFTPKYVKGLLEAEGCTTSALIGGVVRGVFGGGKYADEPVGGAPSVSLVAAHLPNTQAFPFHTDKPSLPPLPDGAWPQLLTSSFPGEQLAAVVLSVPRFTAVEAFLKRLYHAVPSLQVVGGVTEPSAWGEGDVPHGALFLGTKTHGSGAVGIILQGQFQMDTVLNPGYKPFGPTMEVTASQGNQVVQIDRQPAALAIRDIAAELERYEDMERLAVELDTDGYGEFVARDLHVAPGTRIAVAVAEVPVGCKLRMQLRDFDHAQQTLKDRLGRVHSGSGAGKAWAGGLLYSCVTIPFNELDALQEHLPGVQVGGGKVQGEFGSRVAAAPPHLQAYTSSLALFRKAGAAE